MTIRVQAMSRRMWVSGLTLAISLGWMSDAVAQQQSGVSLQTRFSNIWERLIRNDEDKERGLVSRGPVCILAPAIPGSETQEIWHDQPVIVWTVLRGDYDTVPRFVIRDAQTEEQLWEYSSSVAENSVVYDGEPLKTGQVYDLEVYRNANAEEPFMFPEFLVLSDAARRLISNGLENSFEANESSVSDEEWGAIHQAEYFANRDLPFDAIQSLFRVGEPSAELLTFQEQVINESCN